jgi:hypothetical protein
MESPGNRSGFAARTMSDLPSTADWIARPSSEPVAAHPISLSDIGALQVRVHWAEAIAIVEELCAVLVGEDAATIWIPDTQDVLITVQGTVMIRRGAAGTEDIDDLGRMLHTLLDTSDTPMPVRLFIAHSIGSGRYGSIAEYADALAYYGRPGRDELIRTLYQRCLESPLPDVAPILESEAEEVPEPEPPQPSRRSHAIVIAAAVVFAVSATTAVWLWAANPQVTASATRLKKAVTAAAAGTAQRMGWGNPEPSLEASPPVETQAGTPRRGERSRQRSPGYSTDRGALADSQINPAPSFQLPEPGAVSGSPAIEGGFATPPAAEGPGPAVVRDPTVYTSGNPDVQPPVMFLPKLPPVPPVSPDLPGTNTMELLIDEQGLVEEAKLVSQPVRLPDMMLLSGAKTWRFYPALKDGRPVKYRLALSWIVTPP